MSTWSVDGAQALTQALASASAGDTILLAPGSYSGVVINSRTFDIPVTIKSASPADPAVLSDLVVRLSQGLTFADLEFAVDPAKGDNPIQVLSSSNIQMTRLDVHGSLNGDPSDDRAAVFIRASSEISITQSEFHELWIGVGFLDSHHLLISGNAFHDIRMDGVRGGGTSNLEVSGNTFTDFYPVGDDHPDAIQLWSVNTTQSAHDILVADNLVTRGAGAPVQGIFLRDESGGLPYVNVTITGNVLAGSGYNGIALMGARGFLISGNTVAGYSDYQSWIRLENVSAGTVSNNESQLFILKDTAGVAELGNQTIGAITADGAKALDAWIAAHQGDLRVPAALGLSFSGDAGVLERLAGTAGDDVMQPLTAAPVWIEAEAGNDVVIGGASADYLRGGDGDDRMEGAGAFDDMHGNAGSDTLWGGDGDDWVVGGKDDDSLLGEQGFDIVYGNLGNDTCDGGDGDDWVRGGQGDDLLRGGQGADFMSGDRGSDTLSGGAGADSFYLFSGTGLDRVTDFSAVDGDKVRLDSGDVYSIYQVGGDAIIRLASGDEMVLVGVTAPGGTPSWLVFG